MNFSPHAQQSKRRLIGLGFVVALHLLLGYALLSGLARKVVQVVQRPVEVRLIQELAPMPTPSPQAAPPPKVQAAPPPRPAPPKINITPPPVTPTIEPSVETPPPAPPAPVAPSAPSISPAPVIAAVDPAPAPTTQSAVVVCPNYKQFIQSVPYPREALLDGIEGEVVVEFTLTTSGQVRDSTVIKPAHRALNRAALNAVQNRLQCQGQAQEIRVQIPIAYRIK